MKLAIIVPYKNRKNFLDILLEYTPRYIENINGIKDYVIIISEQLDDTGFNRGLSVNVGVKYCTKFIESEYIVAQNVDMIPVKNVDYNYRNFFEAWFLDAGGFKSSLSDFEKINGYCNTYYGWGTEDTDLLDRCGFYNINTAHWGNDIAQIEHPVVCNLELHNTWDSKYISKKYWGTKWPLFINPQEFNLNATNIDKTIQWHNEILIRKNENNRHKYLSLDLESRNTHYQSSGLNQIVCNLVSMNKQKNIHYISYRIDEVLNK
jgi:hypothetical protein